MTASSAYLNPMAPFIGATVLGLLCVVVDVAVRYSRGDAVGTASKEASSYLPLAYVPVIGALASEGHGAPLYLVGGIACVMVEIVFFILLQKIARDGARPSKAPRPEQNTAGEPPSQPSEIEVAVPSSRGHKKHWFLILTLTVVSTIVFGGFWSLKPTEPPVQRADSVTVTPSEPRPTPATKNPPVLPPKRNPMASPEPRAVIVIPARVPFKALVKVTYENIPREKRLWLVLKGTDKFWTYGTCDGGSRIEAARYRESDTWTYPELPIGTEGEQADFTLFVLLVDGFNDRTLAEEYKSNAYDCVKKPWEGTGDVLKDGNVLASKAVRRY